MPKRKAEPISVQRELPDHKVYSIWWYWLLFALGNGVNLIGQYIAFQTRITNPVPLPDIIIGQSYDTVSHFYPDVFVYVIVSFIVVFFIYGYCSFEDRDDLVDVTLKPYLWLWGVMFLLRGFMVLWTSLPDPSSECTASMTVYWYSFIFVSCGSLIFSGHTTVLLISCIVLQRTLSFYESRTRRVVAGTLFLFVYFFLGVMGILMARLHYGIDVVTAVVLTVSAMLWVDKYRPHQLTRMSIHVTTNRQISNLINSGDVPHVLFYGPPGAGKKTRINAMLYGMFGPGVEKIKVTKKTIKSQKKSVDVNLTLSNYHVEFTPSDAGSNDRFVIQELIKEMAETSHVNSSEYQQPQQEPQHPQHSQHPQRPTNTPDIGGKDDKDDKSGENDQGSASIAQGLTTKRFPFRVVVINDVDQLSRDAQHALRRTMEKYMTRCRIILCCESISKVAAPLRSRCFPIRVPAATVPEIVSILSHVARKENLQLPKDLATKIAKESDRNLRKAILMLQASKVERYPFTDDQRPRRADWESFIDRLAQTILDEQSPRQLQLVRDKLYELVTNLIPPVLIIKRLAVFLARRIKDNHMKFKIVMEAAHYEHKMCLGTKPIFHIEAFVAKVMLLYKQWIYDALNNNNNKKTNGNDVKIGKIGTIIKK